MKPQPYQKSAASVQKEQSVKPAIGLDPTEVARRQEKFGANSLSATKSINPFKLFINQFRDVLVVILLISALVSYGVSLIPSSAPEVSAEATHSSQSVEVETDEHDESSEGAREALLIFAIVFAIAVLGFFNEYRAEKTVEALRKLVGAKAVVRRGGKILEVDATELVPGDLVLLEEGVKVPADLRLIKVKNLGINEASLTGESLPVSKNTLVSKAKRALGDQKNMALEEIHRITI